MSLLLVMRNPNHAMSSYSLKVIEDMLLFNSVFYNRVLQICGPQNSLAGFQTLADQAFPWSFLKATVKACDDLPSSFHSYLLREQSMQASKRNLILGLVGVAVLLISMLLYAQWNASHNYNLDQIQLPN